MMKILHVIPSVGPLRGGPSQAVLDMVRALCNLSVDAEIVTITDEGLESLVSPDGALVQYSRVPIRVFERQVSQFTATREFGISWPMTHWLWRNIYRYDLVHVHAIFCYASTVAMLIAHRHHIPYICTTHGLLRSWALKQRAAKKAMYWQIIERSNVNRAKAIHFTADAELADAQRQLLRPPLFVIPHGIDPRPIREDASTTLRHNLGLSSEEPVIVFMSRLHPVKGLDYLIPALAEVSDLPFTFILAGSGDPAYEQQIHRMLAEAGLQERTHCVGFVTGEQKDLLLQGADLFVLTSHSENFGIAVLEALAAGTPVLVTPGVALASVVAQHGLGYVTEMNDAAIAATLRRFLSERETARLMGQNGREFVRQRYAWSRVASDLTQVYESVLNQQPLPNFTEA